MSINQIKKEPISKRFSLVKVKADENFNRRNTLSIPIFHQTILILLLVITATGCESIRYYAQAIQGQLVLIANRKQITGILSQPHTSLTLKNRLNRVRQIRDFAQDQLFLPVDGNYQDYVELGRAYAVWTLSAAPEFSLIPKTWCYPLVGCLSYRSYFSKEDARRYAAGLERNGYDVYVRGTAAYSTLGWFDDPVLSSFVYYTDADLAALIFHELAHHVLFIAGDTTFNEGFATAVEQEGMRRWMIKRQTPEVYIDYMARYNRHLQFVKLVMQYRKELDALYTRKLSPRDMRKMKTLTIERLRNAYQKLKKEWDGYAGYDNWFNRPVNNAQINTVSTYHALVPGFSHLLQTTNGNLQHFYRRCKQLAKEPMIERNRRLKTQTLPG